MRHQCFINTSCLISYLKYWSHHSVTTVIYRPELQDELMKSKGEKKRIRRTLRNFEEAFFQKNGRYCTLLCILEFRCVSLWHRNSDCQITLSQKGTKRWQRATADWVHKLQGKAFWNNVQSHIFWQRKTTVIASFKTFTWLFQQVKAKLKLLEALLSKLQNTDEVWLLCWWMTPMSMDDSCVQRWLRKARCSSSSQKTVSSQKLQWHRNDV